DGLVAGMVVGEDLREEEAQGDPGEVDPLAPLMAEGAAGRRDCGPREDRQEGESRLPCELIAGGDEWVVRGRCRRLSHGDLLGVVTGEHPNRQLTAQGGRCASTRPRHSIPAVQKGYVILVPFVPGPFLTTVQGIRTL